MGVYDTLVDGEESVQVKCLGFLRGEVYPAMRTYNVGDRVLSPEADMTIITPHYPTGHRYVAIKDGTFMGITSALYLTHPPYYDKWGNFLESPGEFIDLAQKPVEDIMTKGGMVKTSDIEGMLDHLCSDVEDCLGYAKLHLMYGDDIWLDYVNDIDKILDKMIELTKESTYRSFMETAKVAAEEAEGRFKDGKMEK